MIKKEFRRINLRVDAALYNQLEKNAEEKYLKVATYTRQLIQQAINNRINNNMSNEKS